VIFQEKPPEHPELSPDYYKLTEESFDVKNRFIHSAKMYALLIEELTLGRMMLDVGYGLPYTMDFFKKRGWLTWGIDTTDKFTPGGSIYKGDFMSYDFSPRVDNETLKKFIGDEKVERKFDLIWMSHILEHFKNPIDALNKAYNLLSRTGVLYIATPDTDFIHQEGVSHWGHWRKNEHYIMWNLPSLKREVERLGFDVIVERRNFSSRCNNWWDIHLIAQKRYF
jgi:SAM-dependent methyltransferase